MIKIIIIIIQFYCDLNKPKKKFFFKNQWVKMSQVEELGSHLCTDGHSLTLASVWK